MKKVFNISIFMLLISGLFLSCQKEENNNDLSTENLPRAVERSHSQMDFTDCINMDDGCMCRLINLNSTGREIDLCPENYQPPQTYWTVGQDLNLYNWRRYQNPLFGCIIPRNDCDPLFAGKQIPGWHLELVDTWIPGSVYANHYLFPHHGVIEFCFLPEGYIRVCNPETSPTEWHLVCEPDAHHSQWETFFLLAGECKLFWVDGNCSVEECEENI